jgi:hypothetical protein
MPAFASMTSLITPRYSFALTSIVAALQHRGAFMPHLIGVKSKNTPDLL